MSVQEEDSKMDQKNYVMQKVNLITNLKMSRFLSEIQEKYTKWAKIVKISISFNRLVFPLNFNR